MRRIKDKIEGSITNADESTHAIKADKAATADKATSADKVSWSGVQDKPPTYPPSAHTHNYAGSGSAGGSANSAVKLDSSAGGATQPVYFKDGKPVATTYALNKTVPTDAKFTDTWRGVQNNLTSTATDQSLSAAQGKVLKDLVDSKAAASHTHNYAGSSSAGGAATSANKLNTNAGSTTQPVYFNNGIPVATTYALNKTVPADAKFTDTNTWRGIQDNLTSDATDQSLSAAQGKALKALVDGKAASNHTHDLSAMINKLSTGGSTPVDADYYVCQYAGGGTSTTTYHRRPMSALWSYIKGKANGIYAAKAHTHNYATSGVSASGSNYVRFGDGTQICWGYYNESNKTGSCSFSAAFANTSYSVAVTATVDSNNAPYITGRKTTSFSFKRNGVAFNNIQWIAIGRWK